MAPLRAIAAIAALLATSTVAMPLPASAPNNGSTAWIGNGPCFDCGPGAWKDYDLPRDKHAVDLTAAVNSTLPERSGTVCLSEPWLCHPHNGTEAEGHVDVLPHTPADKPVSGGKYGVLPPIHGHNSSAHPPQLPREDVDNPWNTRVFWDAIRRMFGRGPAGDDETADLPPCPLKRSVSDTPPENITTGLAWTIKKIFGGTTHEAGESEWPAGLGGRCRSAWDWPVSTPVDTKDSLDKLMAPALVPTKDDEETDDEKSTCLLFEKQLCKREVAARLEHTIADLGTLQKVDSGMIEAEGPPFERKGEIVHHGEVRVRPVHYRV
jgi:hypothetical protein